MSLFRRGLVVGKFSPLHRGHELVLSRAMTECDELCIISYANPELEGFGAARREEWLAVRFPRARMAVVNEARLSTWFPDGEWRRVPHNDGPEDEHRRFCGALCLATLGGPVDAVFTSEAYGDGFAAVLTDCFRGCDSSCGAVTHVRVDQDRHRVPISGTAIRADVHASREWLAPEVYASFVERVCLLGGECSGKTTLAQALAQRLGTRWVPEYGRELWEAKHGDLVYGDLLAIGQRQVALEQAAAREAVRYLVCDTSPLTTLFYSQALFGRVEPRLETLAERRYHHVFLCDLGIPFVQDGTRQDEVFRVRQQRWYEEQLSGRGIPFQVVSGSLEERLSCVLAALRG